MRFSIGVVFGLLVMLSSLNAQSYPSIITLTPASTTQPCTAGLAAASKTYAVCPQNNQITVDFGDGKGYVQLTGGTGPAGPQGIQGVPGQNGAAATVTVGTTTTGPTPAVTNSGTSSAAVLNFVLPVSGNIPASFSCTMTLSPLSVSGGVVSYTATATSCH